jgi:putative ABC transport system permease protein
MLQNYLETAFRNLVKHRMISSINLFGLTVGLSCCLIILIYVLNELSYDRFHHDAEAASANPVISLRSE